MEYLFWHYSSGLRLYLSRWVFLMGWVVHYFSLPLLLPTLFSPYKRLLDEEAYIGFRPDVFFRQLTFNLISRCIGAIVRLFLFICGTLLLIPVFFAGIAGLICWICLPAIGLPYYYLTDRFGPRFFKNLAIRLRESASPVQELWTTVPGKFLLFHLGLDPDQLAGNKPDLTAFSPASLIDIISSFINAGVWDEQHLRSLGTDFEDIKTGASWLDFLNLPGNPVPLRYGRPGVGLELLYGYTPQLNQISEDLSVNRQFSHHLIGRQELVSRIERSLTSGQSVILTGLPGVGKKTIILEFARRAMSGELGPRMVYKRVLELDFNFLLSESIDLNQKKAKFSLLLQEAAAAGNVILVVKDLHRITNSAVEGMDFTDVLDKYLEKRKLLIIAISAQVDYERFLAVNSRLRKYFETIEATAPGKDTALQILFESSADWEKQKHVLISVQAIRAILDGSDRYVTDTPFPEKALELLDHVIVYLESNNKYFMDKDTVNAVLSEKTGISLARLTQKEKDLLGNLEEVLHSRLVGQDPAVSLIAKTLRARTIGTKDDTRPIGSFLFLGPTGVGKTETAKTLAKIYYGSHKQIIRFDMAEFSGTEGVARLIGSVAQNQPGLLTTAIINRPASLLLLDEIEKAPPDVYNLFLSLLDEGSISDAFGKKIDCRHLFVIATSNAGAEFIRRQVKNQVSGEPLQKQVLEYIQTRGIFSPEFLNRFDGVVVYEPLTEDQLILIAGLLLDELKANLLQKNIVLEDSPQALAKLAREGYQPELGARPMRRIVDITLGDLFGKAILSGTLKPGDKTLLTAGPGTGEYLLQPLT